MSDSTADDVRFAFGKNWESFLQRLDSRRIQRAIDSLKVPLRIDTLAGKSFLDIGSGSGLFSLAAHKLGAWVCSIDYDPSSVSCTEHLRKHYSQPTPAWEISQGSILDAPFIEGLGTFHIVYCWGVLHHTGEMWRAMELACHRVAPGGKLFLAIYNDQGRASRIWTRVKRWYNQLPPQLRFLVLWPAAVRIWGPTMLRDLLRLHPFQTWNEYDPLRGMSPWHDLVDWVGGYPFEVATPEQVFEFHRERGFRLDWLTTRGGGRACNEFVFVRESTLPS